jgi:peptidoglycan/LPS O-acetylase OafA/YrhL
MPLEQSQALQSATPSIRPTRSSRSATVRAPRDHSLGGGQLGHRDDIQGLRAVAVLLVAVGHAGVGFLRGGYIGVDVFFVLSGFLITGLLLAGAEKRGYVSLREFYARRAKRILPAAAITLIVTDFAAVHLMNFVRAKQTVLDSIWAAFFSANIQFAHQGADYFARGQPPSPIQHYWSLAVEEQFYLVWPLLLSLVLVGVGLHHRHTRHGRRQARGAVPPNLKIRLAIVIVLAGLGSLAWSIYDTHRTPAATYFSTIARVWELALGAALAIGASLLLHLSDRTRAVLGWAGILAIGVAAVLFSEATAFPGYAALLPTIGTALVIAAGIGNERPRGGVGRLLGRAPLRYVGDRSYAFYLWHWPVLLIAASYVGHDISVGVNLILLAGAFLLSIITYRSIENPIRRATLNRPITTSAVLWGTSVGLVLLVAMFNLRSIAVTTAVDEAAPVGPLPMLSPHSTAPGPTGATPTPGPADSPTSRALPAVIAAVQAARQGSPVPSSLIPPLGRLLDDYRDLIEDCYALRGDPGGLDTCTLFPGGAKGTIALIGDSHAGEWLPAISWMASRDGWTVVPLLKMGCWPAAYDDDCGSYIRWAERQVQILHPDVVLIGGELRVISPESIHQSTTGISMLVDAVKPFAQHVVVIGDPPALGDQPVDCLLARDATLAKCTSTLGHEQVSVYEDAARAAASSGAAFLDTIGWFCFENQCPMVIGRTVTYRENDHITKTYATELRGLFRDAFTRALSG